MSTIGHPAVADFEGFAVPPAEPMLRLSVAQYHQMAEAGILDEDDRVELLEGWLVPKMTRKSAHWITVHLIRKAFERLGLQGFFIHSQDPITTSESEPEPDVAIIQGDVRQFTGHHPLAQNCCFVVEVADSTLTRDRILKKRIYARSSIPTYWIVNLIDRQIEVYTNPSGSIEQPDYSQCLVARDSDEVEVIIDGREVAKLAVKNLLP